MRAIIPLCLLVAACAGPEPPPAPLDRSAAATECRAEAERRFAETPAVSSGYTSYIPGGGPDVLYRDCMQRYGHTP